MKKLILSALFCALMINAQAQSPFTFGPMIGSGFNITTTDLKQTPKPNGSFLGGLFARVSIKKVYIQPEVYYGNKVANLSTPSETDVNTYVKTQIKTGNVNVNALVGLKLLKATGLFNVRVFAGPSTSLLAAKSLYYAGKESSSIPDLKSTTWGVIGGLGVDITKLTIDVRYEQGLTDMLNKIDNINGAINGDVKINSVILTVGFKIL